MRERGKRSQRNASNVRTTLGQKEEGKSRKKTHTFLPCNRKYRGAASPRSGFPCLGGWEERERNESASPSFPTKTRTRRRFSKNRLTSRSHGPTFESRASRSTERSSDLVESTEVGLVVVEGLFETKREVGREGETKSALFFLSSEESHLKDEEVEKALTSG